MTVLPSPSLVTSKAAFESLVSLPSLVKVRPIQLQVEMLLLSVVKAATG